LDIARARRAWRRGQTGLDPAKLIFLDESGAKTNLTRLCGRALRGQRVHASSPQGHWQTTTLIGALRLDGSTACMAIEGTTDTEVFRAYVRQVLCPTLHPGDVVILDNLAPHKSTPTLSLIEAAGAAIRFLPAYSPHLNPIEKMWSKLKARLRTAEARTQPALIQAIAAALEDVTRQDAMNWFASRGYSFI
jgi:transposase